MDRRSIGVVIAAYNAGATIDQAMASIAAQTMPPEQIVVVDDASTDDTASRVARWNELLPIRVLTIDRNAGAGVARRRGIHALETDLVAVLDADDLMMPDHLALLADLHAERGGLIVPTCFRWQPGVAMKEYVPEIPPAEKQLKRLLFGNYIVSAAMFSRDLHDSVGGFRDYRRSQDWDLWLRMLAAGTQVALAHPGTMIYRLRPTRWPVDQILSTHIDILERFIEENDGPITDVARKAIKSHVTRLSLQRSYMAAALGRASEARRLARAGLRGDARLRMRAATMMIAPRLGLRLKRSRSSGTLQIDEYDAREQVTSRVTPVE